MKILVAIKHVPDTEAKIAIGDSGDAIKEDGIKWIVSPYDEFAVEEALKIRDAADQGEVILVCAGPEEARKTILTGLAMGADRAVLVSEPRFNNADGMTRAKAIAAVASEEKPDLILMGKQGVGTDETQTGPMLAELLDMPHVTSIISLELEQKMFTVKRDIEGATEVLEGSLPAVLTCEKGLNEPRYPSLPGIMKAKKKPVDEKSLEDIGLDEAVFNGDRKVVWEAMSLPPARQEGRLLTGDPAEQAKELVQALRQEAKVL